MNLVFCGFLLFKPHFANSTIVTLSLIFALALTLLCRIGMGDFKLWSVLLITNGNLILTLRYFNYFALATIVLLMIFLIRNRNLNGSAPFAPVILAPFLLVYLGI